MKRPALNEISKPLLQFCILWFLFSSLTFQYGSNLKALATDDDGHDFLDDVLVGSENGNGGDTENENQEGSEGGPDNESDDQQNTEEGDTDENRNETSFIPETIVEDVPEPPPSHSENEEEESFRRNRHFPTCRCLQKFRTSYITGNDCGKAALCFWELWNYKSLKHDTLAQREITFKYTEFERSCDKALALRYACLIGYPQTRVPHLACVYSLRICQAFLAKYLYKECEPVRKFRRLPKPQDVDLNINADTLNYDLEQNHTTIFRVRPSPNLPRWNNYYAMSCPVVFRYPFFTIALLLKYLEAPVKYDELSSLVGVAEMLPRYARVGMNNERIINFDALSLEESLINWCGVARNYVCVRQELDEFGTNCEVSRLKKKRRRCKKHYAKMFRQVNGHDPDPFKDRKVTTPMAGWG